LKLKIKFCIKFNLIWFSLGVILLLQKLTCWPIMQKVRCSKQFLINGSTAYKLTDSDLFTWIFILLFNVPSRYFFTIAQFIIFSLRGWFPFIQISYLSFYFYIFLKKIILDYHHLRLRLLFLHILRIFRLFYVRSPLLIESRLIYFPSIN